MGASNDHTGQPVTKGLTAIRVYYQTDQVSDAKSILDKGKIVGQASTDTYLLRSLCCPSVPFRYSHVAMYELMLLVQCFIPVKPN